MLKQMFKGLGIWGNLVALLAFLIIFTERKLYTVHKEGIVLITGASSGIGRHAAEFLADNPNHKFLVLAGVRKESDADSISQLGKSNLKPIILDVANHDSVLHAVQEIQALSHEQNLPFVALVNNAGVDLFYPIEHVDIDDVKRMFDVNFFGAVDVTSQLLPLLRKSKGRVINISSMAGFIGNFYQGMYSSSKFALEAMSDSLRRETESYGVSVSVVQPGYVKSAIHATHTAVHAAHLAQIESSIQTVYPTFFKAREVGVKEMSGAPGPEESTTPAIVHALTSKYPQTRYAVAGAGGVSAGVVKWMFWALSDRLEDMLTKFSLNQKNYMTLSNHW